MSDPESDVFVVTQGRMVGRASSEIKAGEACLIDPNGEIHPVARPKKVLIACHNAVAYQQLTCYEAWIDEHGNVTAAR